MATAIADSLPARLTGPLAFPITPFHRDGSLDLDGLRRNLERLDPAPAAVVAAGGTGELYSLTPVEHLRVVSTAVDACGSAIPVIAGVGFGARAGAELAVAAADVGAAGLLVFPPYYPQADESGVLEYYVTLGRATRLPMLIYSRDWFHPGPAFVERLTAIPTLLAWKDGQGDIRRLQILMSRIGDRLQWIGGAGDDMVPAYYTVGLRAFTSSVANVSLRVAHALHEHASCSAADAAHRRALDALMRDLIVPLYELRARRRGYEVSVMKALMNELGLAGGEVRPPLPELSTQDMETLRAMVPLWRKAM